MFSVKKKKHTHTEDYHFRQQESISGEYRIVSRRGKCFTASGKVIRSIFRRDYIKTAKEGKGRVIWYISAVW